MSEEANKEQTKGAKQENITELNDEQLDEASGGVEVQFSPIASSYTGDTSTEAEISWTTGEYAVKKRKQNDNTS